MAKGDVNDFVYRLYDNEVKSWYPDLANSPLVNALLTGQATQLAAEYDFLAYVKMQTRISTATEQWLDLAAQDYLGYFPRRSNETDNAYRARILVALLPLKNTREAIDQALFQLTGFHPKIFEPRYPFDTGAYDTPSSLCYDVPNVGGYGDTNLPYQFFVQAYMPATAPRGVGGISGYDCPQGAYDIGSTAYVDDSQIQEQITYQDIYDTINTTKAAGTTVWVAITDPAANPLPVSGTYIPPIANGFLSTVSENGTLTLTAASILTHCTGQNLSLLNVSAPTNGTVSYNPATHNVVFVPTANYSGPASFQFTVFDNITAVSARVSVTVTAVTIQPPVAGNLTVSTAFNTLITIPAATILAVCTDASGNTMSITSAQSATNGTVLYDATALQVTFRPTTGYTGNASFTYTITDGFQNFSTGTVTVAVAAQVNRPPVAGTVSVTATQSTTLNIPAATILAACSDPQGFVLVIQSVASPTHGTVTYNASTGVVSFVPTTGYTGSATFSYTISDGQGGTATGTVNVTVALGTGGTPLGAFVLGTSKLGSGSSSNVAAVLSGRSATAAIGTLTVSTSGATGGTGPMATSNFVTVDFTNLTNSNGGHSAVVYPQLFGVSTGGMCNGNFSVCSNATFQGLVKALNPPLLRVNSIDWNSGTPSSIATFATNASKMVSSTCTLIIGGAPGSQAGFKAISDYWVAHGTVPCTYWEVDNENVPSVSTGQYLSEFEQGVAGYQQTNSAYQVGGPVSAGLYTNYIQTLIGHGLGFADYHQYLYCNGSDQTPTNSQVCQAANSGGPAYAGLTSAVQSVTTGTSAANIPIFLGEYNIECGASFNDLRAGTSIGVAFLVNGLMGLASTSTQPAWAGMWDLYNDGGAAYQMIDTSFNTYPQYYAMQKLIATMPGTMVNTASGSNGGGLQAWATKSGTNIGVAIVNSNSSAKTGQVALSHWPINSTGTATIHMWSYPTSPGLSSGTDVGSPVQNQPGTVTTVTVTNGVTANITVPAFSAVILYP